MLEVALALLPATGFAFASFGWPAVFLWLTTLFSGLMSEALVLGLRGQPVWRGLFDGSALLAAWLLALSLPPWAPWWLGALGGFIAIAFAKHVFGGLGQNPFNPAMVARATLLLAYPRVMTQWPAAWLQSSARTDLWSGWLVTLGQNQAKLTDALSGATALDSGQLSLSQGLKVDANLTHNWWEQFVGSTPGSLGETCGLLLLLGGIYLILRGIISAVIPCSVLLSMAVLAASLHAVNPARFLPMDVHLLGGATFLVAFFIATDPVTSPSTTGGRIWFGVGIGVLMYTIRTWAAFPEGAAFAVLFMNSLVVTLDEQFKPRRYGRDRMGRPKPVTVGAAPEVKAEAP